MRSFLTLLFFISFILINEARWKLEWSDEFDKDVFDKKNWEIDDQDNKKCDPQNIKRLNCYTNSSRNIRLIDGTLSLVAIYEKRLNKKFTSAWIKTKKNFTYGRIDIRSALPAAKLLSPWVKMIPPNYKNRDGFVKNNQVIVFYNDQTNYLKYETSFRKKVGNGVNDNYLTDGALHEFHTYSVEWNETDLIWRFDGKLTNWVNLTDINTFLVNEVILTFYLRVGGSPFRNVALSLEDVYEWECSLWAFDYIRYYQLSDEEVLHSNATEPEDRSSLGFCKSIMDETKPKKEVPSTTQLGFTAIISAASLLLLLALIPLIGWLVIRMRKVRDPARKVEDMDNYYDDINNMEMYEEVNKGFNEYDDPYMMSEDNKNYYVAPGLNSTPVIALNVPDNGYKNQNFYAVPDQDMSPAIPADVLNDPDIDYLTMTAKSKEVHENTPIDS